MSRRRSHRAASSHSPKLPSGGSLAPACAALIVLNGIVFILMYFGKIAPEEWILYPGNLWAGRFWTLVTSGFVHHHFMHLFLNMLGLFVFGRIVEKYLGSLKTFMIYFGSLVLSMTLATVIYALFLQKNIAIIGASGAVMGLLSAAVLLDPFCITFEMFIPLPVMVKGWLFLFADIKGFLGGERDGISHLAHLCGFLSIAVLVYFLSARDRKMIHAGLLINIFSFIVFMFLRDMFIHLP